MVNLSPLNTCKLDICRSMNCKQVRVGRLSKEEALNLFLEKVGRSILQVPTLNKEIINSVVEECASLPLAIVTIAGCMSGVEEIHEWKKSLNELLELVRSLGGVNSNALRRLEFSYRCLKDEKVRHCFLHCPLYPEDFAISKDELIGYWIAEGFIKEVKDVQEKFDRGHTILSRLVNCYLLESAEGGHCVKMHDLIRDMALNIIRKIPSFMVQAGVHLLEFPSEQDWKENLERVSLMGSDIREIPSNVSPHCEILSTLLLQENNKLQRIPECFFVHMHGLKVLNLSSTDIEVLRNSVSDSTNLKSLLLQGCPLLEQVPSLAKLLALQYLDLDGTSIKEVPEGMEMLENLTHLYLYSPWLKKISAGILLRLRNLYRMKLYLGLETSQETVKEVARLSNRLDTFEGQFSELSKFNIYVKSSDGRGSKNYRLLLSSYFYSMRCSLYQESQVNKLVELFQCDIRDKEERVVLWLPEDVQRLTMNSIEGVTSLNDVFPRKQGLVNIGKFSHDLKALLFVDCHNLKKLSSLQLLPTLQNLEYLQVSNCGKIEKIVAVDDEETEKELGVGLFNPIMLDF